MATWLWTLLAAWTLLAPTALAAEAGGRGCPCGPATQVLRFRDQSDAIQASAAAEADYLRNTRAAAAAATAQKKREYTAFNWILFSSELKLGWVPVLGQVVSKAADEAREEFRANSQVLALNVIKAGLDRQPSLQTLSINDKRRIVTEALSAAEAQHSFTPSDAFQNEAIQVLLDAVEGINSRTELLEALGRTATPTDGSGNLSDQIALAAAVEKLKEAPKTAGESVAAAQGRPPVAAMRAQLMRGSELADIASGQFSAAGSIATRLGNRELGATLSKGGDVASFASVTLQAAAGNPVAYLPALSGAVNLFGGGGGGDLSWIAGMLHALSQQIEELSKQVAANHKETMAKLEYVAFLGEMSNEGIKALLAKGHRRMRLHRPRHMARSGAEGVSRLRQAASVQQPCIAISAAYEHQMARLSIGHTVRLCARHYLSAASSRTIARGPKE